MGIGANIALNANHEHIGLYSDTIQDKKIESAKIDHLGFRLIKPRPRTPYSVVYLPIRAINPT